MLYEVAIKIDAPLYVVFSRRREARRHAPQDDGTRQSHASARKEYPCDLHRF